MAGTTDAAKVENEAVVLLYCDKYDHLKEIKSCARSLSVGTVSKADADGLLKCLGEVLSILGIENDQSSILATMPNLKGGGTDGASVKHSSIRTNLCRNIPWIYCSWCFAHRFGELIV